MKHIGIGFRIPVSPRYAKQKKAPHCSLQGLLSPSLLALNFAAVIGIILLTVLFGRIYCSVLCPMVVFQDIIIWKSSSRTLCKKSGLHSDV